jgi:hypothetical protein
LAFLPPPEGRHLRQLGIHHWCFHNLQVPRWRQGCTNLEVAQSWRNGALT